MKYIYAPGCALMLYDRELAELLKKKIEKINAYTINVVRMRLGSIFFCEYHAFM